MIRVVIDTNVLVSALLKPESLPAAVLTLALSGRIKICVSVPIYDEYAEVIQRPRFKPKPTEIEKLLMSIRSQGHWVEPSGSVNVCPDPDDNIFLECADAAHADYLVTGNLRHFPDRWKRTVVVNARHLIGLLVK